MMRAAVWLVLLTLLAPGPAAFAKKAPRDSGARLVRSVSFTIDPHRIYEIQLTDGRVFTRVRGTQLRQTAETLILQPAEGGEAIVIPNEQITGILQDRRRVGHAKSSTWLIGAGVGAVGGGLTGLVASGVPCWSGGANCLSGGARVGITSAGTLGGAALGGLIGYAIARGRTHATEAAPEPVYIAP